MSADAWTPPRCIHGHIILGCSHDDCPTQSAYLDQQNAALADWERRGQIAARAIVRQALGLDPTPLDCQCATPTPTPSDMCARCLRIIAARVRARRQETR